MARYIKSETTIPIPRVYAYGRDETLVNDSSTTQAYIILDYIPGQHLDLQALTNDTPIRRKHFYTQLIRVIAQLRKLEFVMSGSLMPGHDGVPVIDKPFSIPLNELQIDLSETKPSSTCNSTAHWALYQLDLISKAYQLPRSELSRETVELELFALSHLQQLIPSKSLQNRILAPSCCLARTSDRLTSSLTVIITFNLL
jgi:hypothetical protein